MRIPYLVICLVGAASAASAASHPAPSAIFGRRPFLAAFASPSPSAKSSSSSGKTVSSDTIEKSKAYVLSLARQIKSDSKTGVFVSDPTDRADLKKAVADLEAVCGPPTERSRQLMIGDWTLLCTTNAREVNSQQKKRKSPFKMPDIPLRDKITKSFEVTQRIRTDGNDNEGSNNEIDRVDNVIEYTPFAETLGDILGDDTPFSALKDLKVNPFEVSQSKISLVHSAEVQSISPVLRTKIGLKSVVLTVAGTSQYLEPDGADLLGLNVPLGEFTNSGSFDTTYVDENLRISRGSVGFVDVLRVFVRRGIDAENEEVAESVEVTRSGDSEANDDVSGPGGDVADRLDEVAGAVAGVVEAVQKVGDDVRDTIQTDVKKVRESVDGVAEAVRDASEDVRGVVEEDMKDVQKAVEGVASAVVGEDVKEAVDDLADAVKDTVDDLADTVKDASEDVRDVLDEDAKGINKAAEGVADAVVGKEVREAIQDAVDENLDNIQNAVESITGDETEEDGGGEEEEFSSPESTAENQKGKKKSKKGGKSGKGGEGDDTKSDGNFDPEI